MPEQVNWPEAYQQLEKAYVATLPPEEQAKYFESRAVKAEEVIIQTVLDKAKDELKGKYPAADPEEVFGKTVTELEASFKQSQARNEKAFNQAFEKLSGEFTDKVKGMDEAVAAELGDVFKAWGKTRVAPQEETANDQAAQAGLAAAGIQTGQTTKPTTIEDIAMGLAQKGLGGMFGRQVAGVK
jgi:hypothetical protein